MKARIFIACVSIGFFLGCASDKSTDSMTEDVKPNGDNLVAQADTLPREIEEYLASLPSMEVPLDSVSTIPAARALQNNEIELTASQRIKKMIDFAAIAVNKKDTSSKKDYKIYPAGKADPYHEPEQIGLAYSWGQKNGLERLPPPVKKDANQIHLKYKVFGYDCSGFMANIIQAGLPSFTGDRYQKLTTEVFEHSIESYMREEKPKGVRFLKIGYTKPEFLKNGDIVKWKSHIGLYNKGFLLNSHGLSKPASDSEQQTNWGTNRGVRAVLFAQAITYDPIKHRGWWGSDYEIYRFVPDSFEIFVQAVNGSIDINPKKAKYEYGESVRLTALPSSGYAFSKWSGDFSGNSQTINISIDSAIKLVATFQPVGSVSGISKAFPGEYVENSSDQLRSSDIDWIFLSTGRFTASNKCRDYPIDSIWQNCATIGAWSVSGSTLTLSDRSYGEPDPAYQATSVKFSVTINSDSSITLTSAIPDIETGEYLVIDLAKMK
ncbi:MAG: hypothetical protein IPK50_17665 [Fibrobacterota bacterium]|nr:MAG: hypothetical protein IPK50_17665 [Fibrobacterota bacterium]